jgi:hypothetical protein
MNQDISKLCADSLRSSLKNKYAIQLKAAHAHELVAAYFGYRSKNALLSDRKYPISDISKSKVVVMIPDSDIDNRRACLDELPENLPDSYTLGEFVYGPLFASDNWGSKAPPFRCLDSFAKYVVENNEAYNSIYRIAAKIPVHHVVVVNFLDKEVLLTVYHTYQKPAPESLAHGMIKIQVSRIAGKIGYGNVKVFPPESWSGGYLRSLESLGVNV